MTQTELFYGGEVFVEEVDFSDAPEGQPSLLREMRSFVARVAATAVVAGILSLPSQPAAMSLTRHTVVGAFVPAPHSHRLKAKLARAYFEDVPLSAVELLPDPDYGF